MTHRFGRWVLPAASTLGVIGAALGLLDPGLAYGDETTALRSSVLAQDLVMVVVVAPIVGLLTWREGHDDDGTWLLRLGISLFLAYNYAIYCFSIGLGPLFLRLIPVGNGLPVRCRPRLGTRQPMMFLWTSALRTRMDQRSVTSAALHIDVRNASPLH